MFEDYCIISCGMLHPEMTHLVEKGFLNPRRILFTPPGLHALPDKLEEHLLKRLTQAQESCPDHRIIIAYGKECYVNTDEPLKRVNSVLQAAGPRIVRVQGDYGYDMLAGQEVEFHPITLDRFKGLLVDSLAPSADEGLEGT